jgi:hypothetical protein
MIVTQCHRRRCSVYLTKKHSQVAYVFRLCFIKTRSKCRVNVACMSLTMKQKCGMR